MLTTITILSTLGYLLKFRRPPFITGTIMTICFFNINPIFGILSLILMIILEFLFYNRYLIEKRKNKISFMEFMVNEKLKEIKEIKDIIEQIKK